MRYMKMLIINKIVLMSILVAVILFITWPMRLFNDPYSTVITDRDDNLLGATVASDQQWRFPPVDTVPSRFGTCIVTFEDKRFYKHPGVDLLALGRAIRLNITRKEVVSGGSTISMQVIRLSRKGKVRNITEKIIEAITAIQMEIQYSKKKILALYASHAPFGGNVVGLEAASWRYFGVTPEKLSWSQSAMLAVLPNSPSLIHLSKNRELLIKKRDFLLRRLYENHTIDSVTLILSLSESLPPAPYPIPMSAPHLLARAKKERVIHKKNQKNNNKIRTTLISGLQEKASAIINQHHKHLSGNKINNAAALIIDVKTGYVVAYCGNVTQSSTKKNNAYSVDNITAPRSTGSILKPFLYAAMLESGEITPEQLIPDMPMRFGNFFPQNYSRTFDGAVAASDALSRSLNVPAVWMLYKYGVDRYYNLLKKYGMSTLFRPASDYGLTLVLGGAEGTLWEITGMYAQMAHTLNGYFDNESKEYEHVLQPVYTLDRVYKNKNSSDQIISAASAWLTIHALIKVARPEKEGEWQLFTSSKTIAWKTGTSYGFRDAWAVGITPEYAIGVWVGNSDGEGRPELTGTLAAAPILFDLFKLFPVEKGFQCPEADLPEVQTCAKSGCNAGPDCNEIRKKRITFASMHAPSCSYCKLIHLDPVSKKQVTSECLPVSQMVNKKWFVLPPATEYFYRKKHFDYEPLPEFRDDCYASVTNERLSIGIIYPRHNSALYIPVGLDGKKGAVVFEASHRQADGQIFWYIDDEFVDHTIGFHQISCTPKPGKHVLTLVDNKGERVQRVFTIMDDKK
jgi:penicillin-binding protein 1C